MQKPLEQQVAVITGSSRGIGKAIALRLAAEGADVMINFARNEDAAMETVREIRKMGRRAEAYQANVGDSKEAAALIEATTSAFGRLDILIHNAAMGAFKPVHKLRQNQWDLSMEINTRAFLTLVQKALPALEKSPHGNIIALSSLGSRKFIPNYGAIGISKAALESLVRYLAVELAEKNIRVNAVSGGLVKTDALKFFPHYEAFEKEVCERTPAGRLGEPDDLARVVAFMAKPDSSWITGQTIIADGGLSLI